MTCTEIQPKVTGLRHLTLGNSRFSPFDYIFISFGFSLFSTRSTNKFAFVQMRWCVRESVLVSWLVYIQFCDSSPVRHWTAISHHCVASFPWESIITIDCEIPSGLDSSIKYTRYVVSEKSDFQIIHKSAIERADWNWQHSYSEYCCLTQFGLSQVLTYLSLRSWYLQIQMFK